MRADGSGQSQRAFPGAIALIVLALVQAIVGFGPKIVGYPIIWASGAQPNGKLPIVTPWWVFVVLALAWAVLLFLTRRKSDQYPAQMHKWLRLENTPRYVALWSILGAFMAILMSFDSGQQGLGLYWIPAVLLAGVGVVAILLGRRQKYER